MSASNGVFRIDRKGAQKVAFGDDQPFEIDIVLVYNQWVGLREEYQDEHGNVPAEKLEELNKRTWQFVHDLTKTEENPKGTEKLTMAEVLHFIAWVGEEKEKLADFFVPKSQAKPSLPESIELRLSET